MLSMSRWDGDFSSASWSLAQTFSADQKVYYVDYPYTVIDVIREWSTGRVKIRRSALLTGRHHCRQVPGQNTNLKYITPPAMLPINWLPQGSQLYRWLSGINNYLLFQSIKRALKKMGFDQCILFNSFNPLYGYKPPSYFRTKLFIYQSRDNIRALEYYLQKHGADLEVEAIRSADISYATSRQLQKDLSHLSGKDVQFLPNAANIELFETAYLKHLDKPEDIAHIDKPIMGYTGNICQRLDYELIKKVANDHKDKALVLVGPKNFYQHTDIDLDSIDNIHFCGPKNISELPAYLQHFDTLLLPFKCNELTSRIYPLKINEYLASGKPVISTIFSDDIRSFADVVYLAEDSEAFSKAINIAMSKDSQEAARDRHARASENSWVNRVESIREQCKTLIH